MRTDLTFITNEDGKSLRDRFLTLIKDTKNFDCLVGYFFASGFYTIFNVLEKTESIRILIGISTDKQVYEMVQSGQQQIPLSELETKVIVGKSIQSEFDFSEDNDEIESGINKFIEWIRNKKLQVRVYPSQNIHAKLYIMSFHEDDRDTGRVITGSSNLTKAGLSENLEFNVELKNPADHAFAKQKFEDLWNDGVDISLKYVQTIEDKTWFNQNITPYMLFLKLLYEYFKNELSQTEEVFARYFPTNFMRLEYQEQAVLNAKKILEEYGGVFIADVVGLGKTFIATLLAGQLDGRTLVIAPPVLLEEKNPGSWPNAFSDFRIQADFKSLGKLQDIIDGNPDKYKNVIIDEAHRFRTESTISYELLSEICRGKRIILVTATPYNNSPKDILSQIKLFQNSKKSTIPNLPDLEDFFIGLDRKLRNLDRRADYNDYIKTTKENSSVIREKVLKYLMVRRTRTEIEKYFSKDLRKQNLKFPEVENPIPLFYQLNKHEDEIFTRTIELISKDFTYSRYMPMIYYTGELDQLEKQSQRNMGKFMKILLVKRLESSFYAFKKSVQRFIHSYTLFIKEFQRGSVYVSKKHANKIMEYLESDDDEAIQKLIDEERAKRYDSKDFRDDFIDDLKKDLKILQEIDALWQTINRDPKFLEFKDELTKNELLKSNKIIVFTESRETAEYLAENLNKPLHNKVLCFSGNSGEHVRNTVIQNFDAKVTQPKDDYQVLISTEVLSEGVNLHRSNVVINYDIPWNPTRMMQRVGRINRVDTTFDKIYTFNFFPTEQSNDQIKLKEAAEAKINAFLTLLGGDAALLTDGEPVDSHQLFNRLVSKNTLTGEDENEKSELKYLQIIKEVRENDPDLFEKVKRLPRKARSAKKIQMAENTSLLTYFRKGKIQKFCSATSNNKAKELDFLSAAELLESKPEDNKAHLPKTFFELLDKNKVCFSEMTEQEPLFTQGRTIQDTGHQILRILKTSFRITQTFTDDQEAYIHKVMMQLEEGALPKKTRQKTLRALNSMGNNLTNPIKVLATLQTNIPLRLLESHYAEHSKDVEFRIHSDQGKGEVILSMFIEKR